MVPLPAKSKKWRQNNMKDAAFDFEKEMKRLDEIVAKISSQDLSLDECLSLYKEGQEIVKKLEKALEDAQEKIEKVIETK